jgi:SAM-dependent methyltransferase
MDFQEPEHIERNIERQMHYLERTPQGRCQQRDWKLSWMSRLSKALWFVNEHRRLAALLDLEWIFGRLAFESYNRVTRTTNRLYRHHTFEILQKYITKDASVLELGCGEGEIANWFAQRRQDYVGVDHHQPSIEKAQARCASAHIQFVKADLTSYEALHHFDWLVLCHVLEHLNRPDLLLHRAHRQAKNLYIEVPDFHSSILNLSRLDLKRPLIKFDDDHAQEFTREGLFDLLHQTGWKVVFFEARFGFLYVVCEPVKDFCLQPDHHNVTIK